MKRFFKLLMVLVIILPLFLNAQQEQPNPFDFGKMWTFEYPPKEWFKKAYGFDPGQEWFDGVRKSSLRFATWCSASFVSPDGLIMTNHHCSRDVVTDLQKEGENFDKTGFYAETLADERKAEGLFVEQLLEVKDVTDEMKAIMANAGDSDDPEEILKNKYMDVAPWNKLRLQVVTYYSGGKYSLYGYKRFDDIRLVFIPEVDMGFFGGDPDNFTYPRYNLDCTLWRAYDENGLPLNTSENYLKFNKEGAEEGEPVFVVGNPGSTERYRTVAQLEYDRDYRYPVTYRFLKNRNDIMVDEYNQLVKDPSKEMEAQALLNRIAGIANGMKAYHGIIKGLNDPELFGRKVAMEKYIRSKSGNVTYWDDLSAEYEKLKPHAWAVGNLSPSGLRGDIYMLMYMLNEYSGAIDRNASQEKLDQIKERILSLTPSLIDPKEQLLLSVFLNEVKESIYPGDMTLSNVLEGKSIDEYVNYLVKKTRFTNKKKAEKCLSKTKRLNKEKDPLVIAGKTFGKRYMEAVTAFQSSTPVRKELEAKIVNQAFKVFGTSLPPDATFTLRISDGIMKGYDYNGTIAPVFTTFYGLYDRYYSHGQKFPWTLPNRWLNPDPELLKQKMNCVSTNDIIGGNSGSPLINKNREAVGLIFDGNIESLPGNFIFDEKSNRTVSVHASAIYYSLKYIYHADRILKELD